MFKSKFIDLYNLIIEQQINDSQSLTNKVSDNSDDEIEKIIKKLDDVNLFGKNERLKNKIIKYLHILKENEEKFYENYDKLFEKLKEVVELPENYANEIALEIEEKFDASEAKSLINYLNNRTLVLDDWCNEKKSFDDLFSSANLKLSNEFKTYLINKTFDSTPSIGKTEILFSIIFDNGRRPKSNEHGDVRVNNNAVEVKGKGARLGGQHGYSKGFLVVKFFKDWFKKKDPSLKSEIDSFDNQSFNFNIDRLQSYKNSFLKLCELSNIDLNKAKIVFKNGIKEMYTDDEKFDVAFSEFNFIDDFLIKTTVNQDNDEKIQNISNIIGKTKSELETLIETGADKAKINKLKKNIKNFENKKNEILSSNNEEKSIFKIKDIDDFINTFLCFSLRYYQLIESFKYFAVVTGNDFIILNEDSLKDKESITKSITILSMPNFTTNAGEQGSRPAIKLK